MDHHRIDAITRFLTTLPSRRDLLRGLAAAGFALGPAQYSEIAEAKKKKRKKHKHKKKPKKATPNEFGCLEVNDPCTSAEQCCSGLCEGKKCRAHDTGTCDQQADGVCEAGNYLSALCNGDDCFCIRTTAGSNYCGGIGYEDGKCVDCQKDADCLALGFPPGSACAPIGGDLICAGLCEGGMACLLPCGYEPPEQ